MRFRIVAGAVVVLLLLFFLLGFRGYGTAERISVVVATSPVAVWSWNTADNSFIVLTMPGDDVIDALWGYGDYSLEALWRLGFIDKKGGILLSDSLSDALGIPVGWYIGTKSQTLQGVSDARVFGKKLFSLSNIFSFMGRGYQTNMPISLFIAFSRALAGARPDKIQKIDAGALSVVNVVQLPDGDSRRVISPDFLDHALGGVFENDVFRREGLSVALYNTTRIPALGSRASRILTNAGILVVTVGNDESAISECELAGLASPLASKTAAYILGVFGCRKVPSQGGVRADLTIRLGSDWAKRFAPPVKEH